MLVSHANIIYPRTSLACEEPVEIGAKHIFQRNNFQHSVLLYVINYSVVSYNHLEFLSIVDIIKLDGLI